MQQSQAQCTSVTASANLAAQPPKFYDTPPEAEPDVMELFSQSLEAETRHHFRLAILGYRGVLGLCFNKMLGHDPGTFLAKLEEAQNRGFLSQSEVRDLEVAVTAGHASSQGKFDPTPEQVEWIKSVTHRVAHSIYQVPEEERRGLVIQDLPS